MNWLYYLSPLVLQTLIWVPTRLFFLFFGHLKVCGLENLKELKRDDKGVIFAVNHSGELDAVIVPAALPFLSRLMPMFYTSRERSFYKNCGWRQIFYGGLLFKLWGAHPVKIGLMNYELSLQTHVEIINHGNTVLIFPEGSTTKDGSLKKGKGGVTYLAHQTGAPIVPIYIKGVFKLNTKEWFSRRRQVSITFGKPIALEELFPMNKPVILDASRDDFLNAAQIVMAKITELKFS
ncbi:MAG: 1-acyl-sn-glycerol-3-phosphate acyltransferase [Parcubacteria group bacterium Gr01-1014_73]|nr:MAG: 1-acyl-sn-glycerol-3-phosphate acyltransferase [Parcubacteria group bacterium Gr01-1014_73]